MPSLQDDSTLVLPELAGEDSTLVLPELNTEEFPEPSVDPRHATDTPLARPRAEGKGGGRRDAPTPLTTLSVGTAVRPARGRSLLRHSAGRAIASP